MVMPFQTFINSVVPIVVGWGETLPGTAQRSGFIDVWLTRPPLWHNWRSNFPSHCGVGKLGCAPGSPCSSAGTGGGVVKQFLQWECQDLSVKFPGALEKWDFTGRLWAQTQLKKCGQKCFPPWELCPGAASLCWHGLKCFLSPFVLPLWSVRGAVTSLRLHVLCTVGIFIACFQIYCDECFTTMGVQ